MSDVFIFDRRTVTAGGGAAALLASAPASAVQAAIARGRPMIAGCDRQTISRPIGGVGLKQQ